jgi:hypothetical protein
MTGEGVNLVLGAPELLTIKGGAVDPPELLIIKGGAVDPPGIVPVGLGIGVKLPGTPEGCLVG